MAEDQFSRRLAEFHELLPLCETLHEKRLLHDLLTSEMSFDEFAAGTDPRAYGMSKLAAMHVARALNASRRIMNNQESDAIFRNGQP